MHAYRLVRDAFEDLKAHRWSDLGKRFGLDAAEVQKVADELAKLDPKPGLQHSSANEAYIIPDLVVEKIDGQYKVFLNDSGLPRLRISKTYQRSEEHTSELQSQSNIVCRLLLEKKKNCSHPQDLTEFGCFFILHGNTSTLKKYHISNFPCTNYIGVNIQHCAKNF